MKSQILCAHPEALPKEEAATAGWILFDGDCGVCRTWVPFWLPTLKKAGFAIAPLQTPWVATALDMQGPELLSDLRLILKQDGSVFAGADVYRFAMQRIPWAKPLFWLSLIPGFKQAFNWGYRRFAQNRYRVSRFCGLQ